MGAVLVGSLTMAPAAVAQDQSAVLSVLLEILRARSVLSDEDYTRLQQALNAQAGPSVPSTPETGEVGAALEAQRAIVATLQQRVDAMPKQVASEVLRGKWYERISLRGYTQFRETTLFSREGVLEAPADRSVNEPETFIIRRGRFIFSGDLSERLYLYAQSDFNASTGTGDYSLQMRDLYADIALDKRKTWRVRLGQSKVPFGFVNLQSSQNRLALERPDGLNSAVEGERDYGAYLMWASPVARQRFRDLVGKGLKGSGDYGVVAVGAFSGQGLNRSDQNGEPHLLARVSYPFELPSGQLFEVGVQGYHGRFVSPTQSFSQNGVTVTPVSPSDGVTDQRLAATFVWYPQPFGVEAEWDVGRGPTLSRDQRRIESASLNGGYVQAAYRIQRRVLTIPFTRWNYNDGGRKFARNAPRSEVNELDFGVELAPWPEVELTAMYTRTIRRTRTGLYPYENARSGNRLGLQVQWNY